MAGLLLAQRTVGSVNVRREVLKLIPMKDWSDFVILIAKIDPSVI